MLRATAVRVTLRNRLQINEGFLIQNSSMFLFPNRYISMLAGPTILTPDNLPPSMWYLASSSPSFVGQWSNVMVTVFRFASRAVVTTTPSAERTHINRINRINRINHITISAHTV